MWDLIVEISLENRFLDPFLNSSKVSLVKFASLASSSSDIVPIVRNSLILLLWPSYVNITDSSIQFVN